ncbi:hypothetical protein A6A19_01125 [Actinobacillus delphinicola]|uniref:5-methylcytosine restriction system specificity protein McrC n=1 Tax=Actinobacillus delphinicola TaxID=51161 RepID=UPI0024411D0C|nr:restriction endonuclease [Actinobacillus delphinicola]MDG6896631.1 hypothetical protein [Actinobacillus delphinicola]
MEDRFQTNTIELTDNNLFYSSALIKDIEKTNFLYSLIGIHKNYALQKFGDKEYEHNTSDPFISLFRIPSNEFKISTYNLIGLVKSDRYSLSITSRFGQNFLFYLIQNTEGFVEINYSSGTEENGGYDWLIACLWCKLLQECYQLGIPKSYRSKQEKTSRIKGKIDPLDCALNHKTGKFLCHYRDHSYQHPMLFLFIQTYEKIRKFNLCQSLHPIYQDFIRLTEGKKLKLVEVLETPYLTNPFYQKYNALIDLSKQILKNKTMNFGGDSNKYTYLFDISMLFEYLIRKKLANYFPIIQKNSDLLKIQTGVTERKLIPDIVVNTDHGYYIFDVKYKKFYFNEGVKREDLFQLHTYIGQYANNKEVKGCGFIYPHENNKETEYIKCEINQHGKLIPFYILFLDIPENITNQQDFNKQMDNACQNLCTQFQKIIKQ